MPFTGDKINLIAVIKGLNRKDVFLIINGYREINYV